MGLQEGHPEKNGVTVDLKDLVSEVRARLQRIEHEDRVADMAGATRDLSVREM